MNTTLLIMAAGIGTRFGEGIKQLTPIDTYGHIIIDYSVHDAISAGFNKIVFVIRHEIEADFRRIIGERIEKNCVGKDVQVKYAFQNLCDIPSSLPPGRTRPWGTGQAILCAAEYLTEPFAVINADDYYGKSAFLSVYRHLINEDRACVVAFRLKNTLSENGGVTRGICQVKDGYLTDVTETKNIVKEGKIAIANGIKIPLDSLVSMNMWGFQPDFTQLLKSGFVDFFAEKVPQNPLTAEFLIPIFVGQLLKEKRLSFKVLETDAIWYGMTYKNDVPQVKKAFEKLIKAGEYNPSAL